MLKNKLVESKLNEVRELMKKHRIVKGYLFGSCVKGEFNQDSDIDVLVEVDDTIDPIELGGHLWDLEYDLEKLFGRKVDLLTTRSLRNPYFIQELNETRQLIYG